MIHKFLNSYTIQIVTLFLLCENKTFGAMMENLKNL